MSSLWRTQRPRFPLYMSDGLGRDYYIKYTNGGYWENQFHIRKKPDYERNRYNNFHTLFHAAAPFKYWGNGHGRETYILQTNGLFHYQKPLCSYQLTDFLRNNRTIQGVPEGYNKKVYYSIPEKKHNDQLKQVERKLINRLYTVPMRSNKKRKDILKIQMNSGVEPSQTLPNFAETCTNFNYHGNLNNCQTEVNLDENYKEQENNEVINENDLIRNNIKNNKKRNGGQLPKNVRFNNTCTGFYNNKMKISGEKNIGVKPLVIKTEYENCPGNIAENERKNLKDATKGKNNFLIKNYIDPRNDLRFIDPRGKYNRTMVPFIKRPSTQNKKFRIVY